MSWNKPGDGKQDKDPWSKQEGPPDLEELFKKFQIKLASLGTGGKGPAGGGPSTLMASLGTSFILFLLLAVYLLSGIYLVQPAERAVVTRFGQYHTTVGPGPHWLPRFIDNKRIVDVEEVHTTRQGGLMLTEDENIVHVEIAIQYRIEDAQKFLFVMDQPEYSLQLVANSALRYVVGHTTLDNVLTRGRSEVAASIKEQISETMEYYGNGLAIVEVAMQPATPPEEVKYAFDDVIRAREDEQRYINEADTYARRIEPIAEGAAQRVLEEAKAYREQVILLAEGETARFDAMLPEYKSAPRVTKDRMYLDTMTKVLSMSPKIMIDSDVSSLMYLPLEQLLGSKEAGLNLNAYELEEAASAKRDQQRDKRKEKYTARESRSSDVRGK